MMARAIGMRREWFQAKDKLSHYDLGATRATFSRLPTWVAPKVYKCLNCQATMCNLGGAHPKQCRCCLAGPSFIVEAE